MKKLICSPVGFVVGVLAVAVAGLVSGPEALAKKRNPEREGVEVVEKAMPAARGGGLASTFEALASNTWVSRSVALPDLGLSTAVVMGGGQTQRDIYFPVPANVPLMDASVQFNGSYMRGDPGRTTLIFSLDNSPVIAKAVTLEKGDTSAVLQVANTPQPSGFLRFGITWNTVIPLNANDSICTDMRSMGNLLRIEPTSRLSYRFDANTVRDLATAWTAMPQNPVVLVSGKQLAPDAYDTAWRVGLTLERAGRRVLVIALPAVGQEVDTSNLILPDALKRISAFSALSQGGKRTLKDAAEVGAWVALTQIGAQHIDVVVSDKTMSANLAAGLDALAAQVKSEAPEAALSFDQWRALRLDSLTKPASSGQMSLAVSTGGATVVVGADAGVRFAEVFDTAWRKVAASNAMVVKVADQPSGEADAVALTALGGPSGSLDVIGYGEWITKFEIGAGALKGRRPTELVMDLSAAPSTWGTVPVASVFLNEVLLASKQMEANGKRERLYATIPSYALNARNVIRVSFVRQLLSDRCRENPGAFPVSVLPSSHLVLGGETSDQDFIGMSSRLAQGGEVLVPGAYLADAATTLSRLIRVSAATDVSPTKSKFVALGGDGQAKPSAAFLALDVAFPSEKRRVLVDQGHLVLADDRDRKLLDIAGLSRIGAASVEQVDGKPGVVYHSVAEDSARYDKPFQLMSGNFAVVGQDGLVAQFDSRSGMDRRLFDEVKVPWFKRYVWWLIPVVSILGFLALLYAASVYRRRKAG